MEAVRTGHEQVSRRRVITLAAAAALSAALAPGTFRLLQMDAPALPPAAVVPPGFRFMDSPNVGIRMAIPSDLTPARPWDLLREDGVAGFFEDVAQRLRRTPDEFLDEQLNGTDVLAVSDDGTCVNVMRTPSDVVPTPAMLASEVESLPLTDVVFGHSGTAFGEATTMRGTMTMLDGGLALPGYVLWARNRRGVFSVQVTAGSDDVVDALFAIVLRTLQPIPAAP